VISVSPTSDSHVPTVKQTGRNIAMIWSNKVLAILAPLIITPIITHHFGMVLTGVWLMSTQLLAHLMLLDAGFTNSLVRFLAGQHAVHDIKKASSYVVTAFFTLLAISCLLLITSPFLGSAFLRSMKLTANNAPGAENLVLLTIIYAAVSLPLRIGYGLIASLHRFDLIQLWDSLGIVLRVSLILTLFSWLQPTLIQLGLIVFGSTLLTVGLTFITGLRINPSLSLRPSNFSRMALGDLSSMGLAALIVTMASVLLMQSSSMITGYAIGPAAVVLIAFPLMIYVSLTPFLATLPLLISPVAAGMSAKGEGDKLLPIFIMTVRYQTSFALLLFIALKIFGHPLIVVWLSGPKLGQAELSTISIGVVILFAGYALSSVAQIGRSIMSSVGHHWPVAVSEFVTAVCGLILGYLLSKFSTWGVLGVICAISGTLAIRGLIWYPLMLSRYFMLSPVKLLSKTLVFPLSIGAITIIVGEGIDYLLSGISPGCYILQLIGIWVPQMICWIALTWYLVVPKVHQQLFINYFLKRR